MKTREKCPFSHKKPVLFRICFRYAVKPVLSGHRIKGTPSIKRRVAEVPDLFPLSTLNETFIKRTPLSSGRGHLKST